MPDEFTRLAEMLATRDGIESYINNMEKLRSEGTISVEQYSTLKAEYTQRLSQEDLNISQLKSELQNLVAAKKTEIENYKFELSKLDTKFKVGELSLEAYQNSQNSIRQNVSGLEQYINYVHRYIQARSSSELKTLFSAPVSVNGTQEVPKTSTVQLEPKGSKPSIRSGKHTGVLLGVGGGVIVLIAAVVAILLLTGGNGQVQIPVEIKGATDLGALHLELAYDTQSLSVVSVKNGEAAQEAILEYNINEPGKVVIGLVSVPGIHQDGSLVTVVFDVQKNAGSTNLNLENISAFDADNLSAISASDSSGSFSAEDKSFVSPTLVFNSK